MRRRSGSGRIFVGPARSDRTPLVRYAPCPKHGSLECRGDTRRRPRHRGSSQPDPHPRLDPSPYPCPIPSLTARTAPQRSTLQTRHEPSLWAPAVPGCSQPRAFASGTCHISAQVILALHSRLWARMTCLLSRHGACLFRKSGRLDGEMGLDDVTIHGGPGWGRRWALGRWKKLLPQGRLDWPCSNRWRWAPPLPPPQG